MDDRQLVLNQVALANMRGKMSNLFKVNEAGTEQFLREGYTGNLQGMYIRSSAGLKSHVKGTGTGYLVNGDVYTTIDAVQTKYQNKVINKSTCYILFKKNINNG